MMDGVALLKFGIGLFALLNPIGMAPLYVSLTEGDDPATRRRIALITAFAVLVALVAISLVGRQMLGLFGITVDDLRIAGGIVVLLIGLSMLQADASPIHASDGDVADAKQKQSPAVVPLAIPMLAGPGAMATVIITSESATATGDKALMALVIALNALVVYAAFRIAVPLQRLLGPSGMNIIVRIMGLIVAAIAVGMMTEGLAHVFPILTGAPAR